MPNLNYMKDKQDERDFKFSPKKLYGKPKFKTLIKNRKKYRAYKTVDGNFLKAIKKKDKNQPKLQGDAGIVDYRKYLSPIKNQGNLGSCVGFAVTALKEYQENFEYDTEIKEGSDYRREKARYDLSEQWTYWKTKSIDPWGPSVEGTSIRYALKVLQKIGCPPEDAWPYSDSNFDIGKPESWANMVARWNTIESYWRINSVDEMKSALKYVGPVLAGVGCYEEIFRPAPDGFVAYPAQPEYCYGGHAILICGYNEKTQRFLFRNSWGIGWGAEGYGWLGYDYMRDFCWDAWVAKDHRVTRAMLKGSVTL